MYLSDGVKGENLVNIEVSNEMGKGERLKEGDANVDSYLSFKNHLSHCVQLAENLENELRDCLLFIYINDSPKQALILNNDFMNNRDMLSKFLDKI